MSFLRIALHVIVVGAVAVPTRELIEGECSTSGSSAPVAGGAALVQKRMRFATAQAANSNGYAEVPPGAFYPTSLLEAGGVECQSWCESDYNDGKNQGRHCSPGDMAYLCGGCSFCEGTPPASACDEASWPDNERTCGECKILVDRFDAVHGTCNNFCASVGRDCVDAWEEIDEDCNVKYDMTCDQSIASSDAICQCGDELAANAACWGQLSGIAVDEGNELAEVSAASADSCKQACYSTSGCNSFSYCPEWNKCWLKDRSFTGGETTTTGGECRTHYKTTCGASPTPPASSSSATTSAPTPTVTSTPPSPTPAETCESQWGNMACAGTECYTCGDRITHLINSQGHSSSAARTTVGNEFPAECGACSGGGGGPAPTPPTPSSGDSIQIRVVSYNLYWWNAFQKNSWKSQGIVDNIRNTLRPDTLGMQECDDPGQIQSRAGYYAASQYAGAQGVSVKTGVFSVESSGSRDIQATGYWGPRYVTWAKLRHSASGLSFWHFNTHWCVRDCDQWKRYGGAKNMVSTIQEMAGSEPVVVTGDFNAGQGEPGIQHFLQNGFAIAEWNWVDSVFYSTAHWTRVGHSVGDAAGSDHSPIVADLRLN